MGNVSLVCFVSLIYSDRHFLSLFSSLSLLSPLFAHSVRVTPVSKADGAVQEFLHCAYRIFAFLRTCILPEYMYPSCSSFQMWRLSFPSSSCVMA